MGLWWYDGILGLREVSVFGLVVEGFPGWGELFVCAVALVCAFEMLCGWRLMKNAGLIESSMDVVIVVVGSGRELEASEEAEFEVGLWVGRHA
jgi:hypothetical protein